MKKRFSYSVSVNSDLTARTKEYFQQSGFEQVNTHDGILKFKRGSVASNMWTPHPLKWKSTVLVDIKGQEIVADINVNSIGNILSQKDKNLWDAFIDNYNRFLTESNFDINKENEKILSSTHRKFVDCSGFHFIIGLSFGLLGSITADWFGVNSFVLIGVGCGAYLLLTVIRNVVKELNAK